MTILPKAIDTQTIQAHVSLSNNVAFISFGYTYYENYNPQTGDWDSLVVVDSTCTYDQLSWSAETNTNGDVAIVNLYLGGNAHTFSIGEYFDFNGNPFNLGMVPSVIINALRF